MAHTRVPRSGRMAGKRIERLEKGEARRRTGSRPSAGRRAAFQPAEPAEPAEPAASAGHATVVAGERSVPRAGARFGDDGVGSAAIPNTTSTSTVYAARSGGAQAATTFTWSGSSSDGLRLLAFIFNSGPDLNLGLGRCGDGLTGRAVDCIV